MNFEIWGGRRASRGLGLVFGCSLRLNSGDANAFEPTPRLATARRRDSRPASVQPFFEPGRELAALARSRGQRKCRGRALSREVGGREHSLESAAAGQGVLDSDRLEWADLRDGGDEWS